MIIILARIKMAECQRRKRYRQYLKDPNVPVPYSSTTLREKLILKPGMYVHTSAYVLSIQCICIIHVHIVRGGHFGTVGQKFSIHF